MESCEDIKNLMHYGVYRVSSRQPAARTPEKRRAIAYSATGSCLGLGKSIAYSSIEMIVSRDGRRHLRSAGRRR
jgi:hypothetical protein